ncbi:unnamed protein product [Penicillium roqueforti FM164]|uniref:Genomic scaffold, ProqFM164S02 n=1 Tax=Penicillium roqueforti (strain FM164) TaxID=1365484 RepID=W6QAV3_PENRF|nr:unnamed protein product [Penicillium roqueforti FM164]
MLSLLVEPVFAKHVLSCMLRIPRGIVAASRLPSLLDVDV